jgi:hypothetical protein
MLSSRTPPSPPHIASSMLSSRPPPSPPHRVSSMLSSSNRNCSSGHTAVTTITDTTSPSSARLQSHGISPRNHLSPAISRSHRGSAGAPSSSRAPGSFSMSSSSTPPSLNSHSLRSNEIHSSTSTAMSSGPSSSSIVEDRDIEIQSRRSQCERCVLEGCFLDSFAVNILVFYLINTVSYLILS